MEIPELIRDSNTSRVFLPERYWVPNTLELLRENSIPFEEFNVSERYGIMVQSIDFEKTCEVLNVKPIEECKKTEYEGVVWQRIAPKFRVIVNHWDGREKGYFVQEAVRILFPVIKQDVFLNVPHKSTITPVEGANFWIHIWSSPTGVACEDPPTHMWDIKVDCRDKGFVPSGKGIPIFEPGGWCVAELCKNNLYIHHDVCHHGSDRELRIWQHILQETVKFIALSKGGMRKLRKQMRKEREDRARRAYVKLCSDRYSIQVKKLEESVADNTRNARAYREKMITAMQTAHFAEKQLGSLRQTESDMLQALDEEFEKIRSFPQVRRVTIEDTSIVLKTKTLYCRDPRTEILHEIGAFSIRIDTTGRAEQCVTWFNETRRVDGHKLNMHAPHVFPQGQPCWGNMAGVIPELIGSMKFLETAVMAIQFIEQVNVDDDAGKHIDKWPAAAGSNEGKKSA